MADVKTSHHLLMIIKKMTIIKIRICRAGTTSSWKNQSWSNSRQRFLPLAETLLVQSCNSRYFGAFHQIIRLTYSRPFPTHCVVPLKCSEASGQGATTWTGSSTLPKSVQYPSVCSLVGWHGRTVAPLRLRNHSTVTNIYI